VHFYLTTYTLYPKDNNHFTDVFGKYEDLLTPSGKKTFKYITYEELFSLMHECLSKTKIPLLNEWIDYLQTRYIVTNEDTSSI